MIYECKTFKFKYPKYFENEEEKWEKNGWRSVGRFVFTQIYLHTHYFIIFNSLVCLFSIS